MSRPNEENPKDRFEKTARELRKHRPRPSAALVARVERLAERQSERRPARPRLSRRRMVFALAAALAVAVAGAVVAGQLGQSSKTAASGKTAESGNSARLQAFLPAPTPNSGTQKSGLSGLVHTKKDTSVQYTQRVLTPSSTGSGESFDLAKAGTETTSTHAAAGRLVASKRSSGGSTPTETSLAGVTSGNRLAELHATLTLKVANSDELSRKTAEALHIARSLSGHVVSTDVSAPSRGVATAYLVLKVPAKRSQEALIRISELGKILSQKVSLVDVAATINTETESIDTLKREIASLEQTLSEQTLTAQARSQLQIQLGRDRAQLSSLKTQRTKDILRGRLATITLTLTTGDLPKPATHPSRVHKAIDRAWNGLSAEISWAAIGIIVASPFLVVGIALLALLRVRRRREERRLLEK